MSWEISCRGCRKKYAELRAACAAEKSSTRAKSLQKVSTLWVDNEAQKKRIEDFTRRLTGNLSTQEWNFAEKRHTENAVAVKGKLTEQAKHLSVCVTELDGEAMNGRETVADLNVKLKAAEERAEYVAYEGDGLQI